MKKNFSDLSEFLQKSYLNNGKTNLEARTYGESVKQGSVFYVTGVKNFVVRIISNQYGTVVLTRRKFKRKLEHFLSNKTFPDALLDPMLCDDILNALGLNLELYPYRDGLESEGRHGCRQTTEWICSSDTFQPYEHDYDIEIFNREDVGWRNDDEFDNKLFRVMSGTQVAGYSNCKENTKFTLEGNSKVYTLKVGTNNHFRKQGIGKATACANLSEILSNNGIVFGEVKPYNEPAVRLAQSLGFVMVGGEIIIR